MTEEFNDYPCYGYVYNDEGFHTGGIVLTNETHVENFLLRVAPLHIRAGREVMVTDSLDQAIFHSKHGKILWPPAQAHDAKTDPR
jgi:hypothetical protein